MDNSFIVYQVSWIIERIYEVSDQLRTSVKDQTHFEERCINRISRYIKGDPRREKHRRYIEGMIQREASDFLSWCQKEDASIFTELVIEDDGEQEIEFEPLDVLANVESEVIRNETVTLLAEGDCMKSMILQSWADGNDNIASISRSLARSFGGNVESNRKAVNRFRTTCRKQLSTAI